MSIACGRSSAVTRSVLPRSSIEESFLSSSIRNLVLTVDCRRELRERSTGGVCGGRSRQRQGAENVFPAAAPVCRQHQRPLHRGTVRRRRRGLAPETAAVSPVHDRRRPGHRPAAEDRQRWVLGDEHRCRL